jgi:uncharacterized protein YjbI with pentapeptide repeats
VLEPVILMANEDPLIIIRQGVEAWNKWKSLRENDFLACFRLVNLRGADLDTTNLSGANLSMVDLSGAKLNVTNLSGAYFVRADLTRGELRVANLRWADLSGADLRWTDLTGVDLNGANLNGADLSGANLNGAELRVANLSRVNLREAKLLDVRLRNADLRGANLRWADLTGANINDVDLSAADLSGASLVETTLVRTKLTGCRIYGISAWGLKLDEAEQRDLIITPEGQPTVTVDNIEVAQFVYLLLHNEKIRQVIDTITSKVVLILGRFTPERKAVLDAIREELRKRGYVPVLFDFDKPDSRDITETVTTLARLARFVIADITDPKSIPLELQSIVPDVAVPVQPLLLEGSPEFSMFRDLRRKYHWVLQVHIYKDPTDLFFSFDQNVIAPAVAKANELRDGRK